MNWETIRGAGEPLNRFRRSIERGRLAHAYLFVGPQGIGKKLFARSLAQCLLCQRFEDVELEACGECSACRQMRAGTHPDFFLVGCPEGKNVLPIEVFAGSKERRGREGLCYELSLRPMAGGRKIAVIDDTNLMNAESANALLKTLEEPPPHSLLILIATTADGLLPTIRSRCQQVRFAALPEGDVADLLVELELVEERREAESVAALSGGSLTVAGQLLDPALRGLRESLYDGLAAEHFNSLSTARQMIEGLEQLGGEAATQREGAGWLVRFAIEFYRRAALELAGDSRGTPIQQVQEFAARFQRASADDLELVMEWFDRCSVAAHQLERHMPVALCLEGLLDALGRIGRSAVNR